MQGMSTFSVAATVALGRSMDNVKRGPSCPVTKMLPPPHLRAGSSIGSDWGLLPLLYQVTMAQRGNGNSNGNGNGNGTGGYGTDGLNANILKADILRRYVSCLDFKCSEAEQSSPHFSLWGQLTKALLNWKLMV